MACGILVPQPGIEPGPPAMKAQSPNHWIAREFPTYCCYFVFHCVPEVVILIVENSNDSEACEQRNRSFLLPRIGVHSQQLGEGCIRLIPMAVHDTHTHVLSLQTSNASHSCLFQGHVLFRPTVSQQQTCPTCSTTLLNGDFKVTYDVNRDNVCDLLVSLNC